MQGKLKPLVNPQTNKSFLPAYITLACLLWRSYRLLHLFHPLDHKGPETSWDPALPRQSEYDRSHSDFLCVGHSDALHINNQCIPSHCKDKKTKAQGIRDLSKITWRINGRNKMKVLVCLIKQPGFQFLDDAGDLLVCSEGLILTKQRSGLCPWLPGGDL